MQDVMLRLQKKYPKMRDDPELRKDLKDALSRSMGLALEAISRFEAAKNQIKEFSDRKLSAEEKSAMGNFVDAVRGMEAIQKSISPAPKNFPPELSEKFVSLLGKAHLHMNFTGAAEAA